MTEEITEKKSKPKFDLSDGFGREDISAVFAGIWHAIIAVLKVLLYPYVWIARMFGRTIRFSRTKDRENRLLNKDERSFMESVPGFFVLTGLFLGILLGVIFYIIEGAELSSFFETLELTDIIKTLGFILGILWEIILWIIGIDKRDEEGNVILDRFGLLDIVFDIILAGIAGIMEVITEEPLMLFIGFGVIGVALAIIWIAVSETGIVSAVLGFIVKIIDLIVTTPDKLFDRLNSIYLRFNNILSTIVIGKNRLSERNVAFHRKILLLTVGLGLYTFVVGIFILVTRPMGSTGLQIGFIFIILLVLGLGVGIIEMFIITRFLDAVSRGKYTIAEKTVT
ncbi:MAG: hypothetical protein ACFE95_14680 [Candidatus Hodarchaeota archaeon]